MTSVSSDIQEATGEVGAPVRPVKPKKAEKKTVAEKSMFVGRIADLEVSTSDAATPQCIFHLKGKKTSAKQSFSIPASDPNFNGILLQTALFSFANQIKVHISAKPSAENRLTVNSIKLSQRH